MTTSRLDSTDLQILTDLQDEGRMTNVELAKRAGISAPPCLRRLRALEDEGFIEGYHADLNPQKLGYNVVVFAQVGLNKQSEEELIAFENLTREWSEVRECYMLSGEHDFLLKIVAENLESFQKFVNGKLTPVPNVSNVKTSLCLRTSVIKPGVEVPRPNEVSDKPTNPE
ncbi:MAG: Lrp/AsnC family transcriptional regulator [Alphaproteobacteria bacterium]